MKKLFAICLCFPLFAALPACDRQATSSPPAASVAVAPAVAGDPHLAEQEALAKGTPDFSNLMVVRLQSDGRRVEVTSVLPAKVAETIISGQSAKTIFRINEKSDGLILFSRDLPNGKSFRTDLSIADLEKQKSFSFPVVQPDGSLSKHSFVLEKIVRQP